MPEIHKEGRYSIWKTRYGEYYYVFEDFNTKPIFECNSFEEAIRFIKGKL